MESSLASSFTEEDEDEDREDNEEDNHGRAEEEGEEGTRLGQSVDSNQLKLAVPVPVSPFAVSSSSSSGSNSDHSDGDSSDGDNSDNEDSKVKEAAFASKHASGKRAETRLTRFVSSSDEDEDEDSRDSKISRRRSHDSGDSRVVRGCSESPRSEHSNSEVVGEEDNRGENSAAFCASPSESNGATNDYVENEGIQEENGGAKDGEETAADDGDGDGNGSSSEDEGPASSATRTAQEEGPPSTPSGSLDFDLMLERKRQERGQARQRHKRRRDIDMINDNDDAIARLVADMRQAARDDRELNLELKPATKKIGLLATVQQKLAKVDLQLAFVEANILSVMTDWLAPMPLDKALPHIRIRTAFLNFLQTLPIDDESRLKESGIGKAVMYLYRHPKESRANKDLAGKIISKWSRPIFQVNTDFASMTREDRQQRDFELAAKFAPRACSPTRSPAQKRPRSVDLEPKTSLRPGDPGWINRARVPQPGAGRDYVQRPQWQSQQDLSKESKKSMSLLEKHKRRFADKRKLARQQQAVKISLEGKNMQL